MASMPPRRMSSRIRGMTPSTPQASQARTGITPGRSSRKELPGVDAARSTAYGARSRQEADTFEAGSTSLQGLLGGDGVGSTIPEETAVPQRTYQHEVVEEEAVQESPQAAEPEVVGEEVAVVEETVGEAVAPVVVGYPIKWFLAALVLVVVLCFGGMALNTSLSASIITSRITPVIQEASEGLSRQMAEQLTAFVPPAPLFEIPEDLKEVNILSPALGSVVDPHLTSPVLRGKEPWLNKIYSRWALPGIPMPPIAALEPWEGMGDAWCTGPKEVEPDHNDGTKTKAQLAVILPAEVYPVALTVEHIPPSATFDIDTAPQWIELWIQVTDVALRDELEERIERLMGTQIEYGHENPSAFLAHNPEPTGLNAKELRKHNLGNHYNPPSDFVRVGKFHYDIEDRRYVQKWELPIDLEDWIKTQKVIIRVVQNYGREWTCLYRVRLSGLLAAPMMEYA